MATRPFRRADEPRSVTPAYLAAIVVGLVVVALIAREVQGSAIAWVRALSVVFASLVLSALPFVALGAIVAAAVAVLVPQMALERIGTLPKPLQLPAAAMAGVALPICECGSVPIARRLIQRDVPASAAITFMLAAPIVNPVVIVATAVAYRGRGSVWLMAGGRFLMGAVVAMIVGWAVGGRQDAVLRPPRGHGSALVDLARPEPRLRRFFQHVADDFAFMARYLLLGALAAAVVQTFLPQPVIGAFAGVPVIETVAMMALAAALSLCSESDAFIAASFGQYGFGPASQLAFLVFGPMVDLKLGAMYAGAFRRRAALALVIVAGVATLGMSLWINVVVP
jgi:uncharacterized membrane protein YraQ (UPF0718 family)